MRALDAVRADGERHVHAVVDDQNRRGSEGPDPAAQRGELSDAEVLLAHLNGEQPGGHTRGDDLDEIAAARLATIGDEAEPQLVQSGTPSRGEDAVA